MNCFPGGKGEYGVRANGYYINANDLSAGWSSGHALDPRAHHNVHTIGGKVYILGGHENVPVWALKPDNLRVNDDLTTTIDSQVTRLNGGLVLFTSIVWNV